MVRDKVKDSVYNKRRRIRLKEARLCTVCGQRPLVNADKCEVCNQRHLEDSRESHTKTKQEVFDHYGGRRCACCETTYPLEFLHIDHVGGKGNEHRRKIGGHSGGKFYRWLKRNGFPNGYRVLCANCNLAHGFFGRCPCRDSENSMITKIAAIALTY